MKSKYSIRMDPYDRIINLPNTLNIVLWVVMSGGFLAVLVLLVFKAALPTIIAISMLPVVSFFLHILNRRGKHKTASFGAFLLTASVLTYVQVTNNGLYDVSLLAYPALIVFSSLLLGTHFVIPITLIMVAVLTVLQQLTVAGIVTPYDGKILSTPQDYWSIVIAIVATGLLVYIITSLIGQNVTKIIESEQRIKLVYENTLKGWARALELRDHETEGHSQRVTRLTIALAKKLGVAGEELVAVRWGAILHDIGKMSVPDAILLKRGRLSTEEFDIIKKHPETAYTLLENIPYLQNAMEIPHSHHERWDGSGYPRGLKGEDIPLAARIFSVVDVWDALRVERPYKKAWSAESAVAYLEENAGTLFDPNVVSAFVTLLEEEQEPVNPSA